MRRKINIFFILALGIISNTISFIVFQFNFPQKVYFEYKKIFYRRLIVKGINLTLYNLSFYLMAILTTTFVSIYCSVEDLGQYSFASSIGNAVTMASGAFSYIFYPKMINKFASGNYTQITLFLKKIRNIYILGTDCIVLLSILLIPIAGIFLPQYKSIGAIFSLYILSKVMINSTSGYAAFLIAKQKERILTVYGFLSIIILVSINIIFAYFHLNMKFIALSLVIASFVYAYLVIRYGRNCLNLRDNIGSALKEIIGTYRWLMFLTILIYVFIFKELVIIYAGTITYVFVNREKLHNILNESYVIVTNPNSLNF
jgi:O-antigen/teichoic acid export membrane protein